MIEYHVMAAPLTEFPTSYAGQTCRVLLWDRDLVDMWVLDAAGRRRPFRGRGSVWHAHADLELTCITEGEGLLQVGDHSGPFAAPDCLLLGSGLPHVWLARGASAGVSIQFAADAAVLALPELEACAGLWRDARHGLRWTGDSATQLRSLMGDLAGGDAASRVAQVVRLLDRMRRGHPVDVQRLSARPGGGGDDDAAARGMGRVLDHLLANFAQPLRVADLVRLAGCAPATFNRRFARLTGGGVVAYVNRLRVHEAQRRLVVDDDSVTDVAFASGFANLSHFNAEFKRRSGCTPSQWRRRHRI